MGTNKELPVLLFESQSAWRGWLDANHLEQSGVWVKIAKKGSGHQSVSYDQAVEEALCYGWIDGQKRAADTDYWLQKFTPRNPRSVWSKVNLAKAEHLIASGRMNPSGLAAVEAARTHHMWDAAYDSPSTMTVPEDFQAALAKNPKAQAFFATLDKTNVYAFCWRVRTARTEKTRMARIQKFVAMLEQEERLH